MKVQSTFLELLQENGWTDMYGKANSVTFCYFCCEHDKSLLLMQQL